MRPKFGLLNAFAHTMFKGETEQDFQKHNMKESYEVVPSWCLWWCFSADGLGHIHIVKWQINKWPKIISISQNKTWAMHDFFLPKKH